MKKISQFDWSRNWTKKVEPHLHLPLVRASVEMGMTLLEPDWTWNNGPHSVGRGSLNGQRVTKNKLSWFPPWGRCHWISFFACAIGVINYQELDWQFISGPCHTVPVGSRNGENGVVTDILNFKSMTAEQSIAHVRLVPPGVTEPDDGCWPECFALYVQNVVPRLRELAVSRKPLS